jgi:ATP-dependent DNA helicase RecG
MIPELLREIIADGESLNVEFKGEEKKGLEDSELVEAVICLANRRGMIWDGFLLEWKTIAA